MPIDELGLRVPISRALKKIGIVYLEDVAEVDEQELLSHEAIGVKTTARLRDLLRMIGLSFRPPTGEERRRTELASSSEVAAFSSAPKGPDFETGPHRFLRHA